MDFKKSPKGPIETGCYMQVVTNTSFYCTLEIPDFGSVVSATDNHETLGFFSHTKGVSEHVLAYSYKTVVQSS